MGSVGPRNHNYEERGEVIGSQEIESEHAVEQQGYQDDNVGLLFHAVDITKKVAEVIIQLEQIVGSIAKPVAEMSAKVEEHSRKGKQTAAIVSIGASWLSRGLETVGVKPLRIIKSLGDGAGKVAEIAETTTKKIGEVAETTAKIAQTVEEGVTKTVEMIDTAVKVCSVAWGILKSFV